MDGLMEEFKAEYKERGNRHLLYQVPYLSELARRYQEKDDWPSLLRAHALYNSCAVRDPANIEQWLRKAYKVQLDYWNRNLQSFSEHLQVTQTLKQELGEIRNKWREQTERRAELFTRLNCEPEKLSCSENKKLYAQIQREIPILSTCINQEMVRFTKSVIDKALAICGSPTSGYCAVALGSLARGEATPYSDLEFMFLTDLVTNSFEVVQYFRKLSITIYFLIGNLRETNIRYMAIPELMSYSSNTSKKRYEHWFTDSAMNGFKIDGLGQKAGNIPTGNGTKGQQNHLICTVSELIERYKSVLDNPDSENSLTGDLTAMLASTIYISGRQSLHNNFRSLVASCKPNEQRREATEKMLTNDTVKFDFKPDFDLTHTRQLKRDVYRYPSLLVYNLKILHNIQSCDPWETIRLLETHELISLATCKCLKFSLCCAQIIRLSAYFYHNSQNEDISVLSSNADDNLYKGAWYLQPELLIHMFIHLLPLKEAVSESINRIVCEKHMTMASTLTTVALTSYYRGDYRKVLNLLRATYPDGIEFATSAAQKIYVDSAIQCNCFAEAELVLAKRNQSGCNDWYDIYLLAHLYEDQSMYSEALASYKASLDTYSSLQGFNHHQEIVAEFYNRIGLVLAKESKYSDALAALKKCQDTRLIMHGENDDIDVATISSDIGEVLRNLSQYNEAHLAFRRCLDMLLRIYGDRDHKNIVSVLSRIGVTLSNQGRYREALAEHRKCLGISLRIHGGENHVDIASTLGNIGEILIHQCQHTAAHIEFVKCLDMYKRIYKDGDHVDIAKCLGNVGEVLRNQGQPKEAHKMFRNSLKMMSRLYGKQDHSDIANLLYNIGAILAGQCKFREALIEYNKCKDMWQRIYGDKNHVHIADVLCNIGVVLLRMGHYSEAYIKFNTCLTMYAGAYGEIDHPNVAHALLNIGAALASQGQVSEALLEFRKCHDMMRRLCGSNDHVYIANAIQHLGSLLVNQGRHREALVEFEKCLGMYKRLYRDRDHVEIAHVLLGIGLTQAKQLRYAEALAQLSNCLAMMLRIHSGDKDHAEVSNVLWMIGIVLHVHYSMKQFLQRLRK